MTPNKRKTILYSVFALFLIVFGISSYLLISNYMNKQRHEKEINELRQIIAAESPEAPLGAEDIPAKAPQHKNSYDALYARNKDYIGWISVDGTELSYPLVQNKEDTDFYLDHNFLKNEDFYGTPYLDHRSNIYDNFGNIVVYGHNMRNGKIFGTLGNYAAQQYYKEHPVIKVMTMDDTSEYEVVSYFTIAADDEFQYYNSIDLSNEETFNEFAKKAAELSIIKTESALKYGRQVLTLSTCDSYDYDKRLVLVAQKTK